MIRSKIKSHFQRLTGCSSGNATMLVALGMPVLIGGAGLGIDMTQWYMWKRELQFAVDQAAIAGAWAAADTDTAATFTVRAQQEFDANLSVTDGFKGTPTIQLADFAGGTANSVAVSATVTKELPFSSFISGGGATIYAYAQASFEEGTTFTSCLIATHVDEYGAVTIGGNSVLTASCGIAALSTNETAVAVNGNPEVDAGWILAAGGVDQWLKDNTDDIIMENMTGLYDPFKDLTPPEPENSKVQRTYSCKDQADTTTANRRTVVRTTYAYFQGSNERTTAGWANTAGKETSTTPPFDEFGVIVASGTKAGVTVSEKVTTTQIGGSGNDKKYERKTETTTTTISNVLVTEGETAGNVVPGTYNGIHVGCATTFQPGVYIIDGGTLKITGQYEVTGSSVMFVLKNGASIDIAGGADINLTAIQVADLIADGIHPVEANKLAGMLVFEDRDNSTEDNKINGNADTILNGTVYLPNSGISFAGTATVTTQCLMIAASTITITGTTNMSTFCPADSSEDTVVASIKDKIRLVA